MSALDGAFADLLQIMDRLRDPGGCPWDREQTYATLRNYLLEECYEVVEALDAGDRPGLREELGDLLFQIVFLSRLAKEEGAFTAEDVARGIAEKMVRRHPHVFGDGKADTSEEVLRNWEEIKRSEKGAAEEPARSVLAGIPRGLPALLKAQRLGTKAARVGFDWHRDADVLDKIDEEVRELRQAAASGRPEEVREEFGDLLFALVMLGRRLEVDAEEALEGANRKFQARFHEVERRLQAAGIAVEEAGLATLDRYWDEVKKG
jgi:tetrapyrrole methylase family protein/MazG family protein